MRIAIVCNDTRGGVQPYAALGSGLQDAGHDVGIIAPSNFAPVFTQLGLPVSLLSGNIEEMLQGTTAAERGMLASMRFMARELPAWIQTWTRETLEACEGVDVVTGGVGGMVVGLSVAEKLGIPFLETHLQPLGVPTDAYPGVLLSGTPRWFGSGPVRLSHYVSDQAVWMPFRGAMTSARKSVLGLPGRPKAADDQPVLFGFSPLVVPLPTRGKRSRYVTGYWSLPTPTTWRPPPGLEAFLEHRPVVSIGFGSMTSTNPEAVTSLVLNALRTAGVRAVLLGGRGGMKAPRNAEDVFFLEAIPHDWLFARVAAAVHHGGAGTTGAAIRAGIPAIVVPFTMDQPFWGSRVAQLGVGPTPIPRARLTKERLAGAIRATMSDGSMRARAHDFGELVRAEDGVATAVQHFAAIASRLL